MKPYETTFVLDSSLDTEAIEKEIKKVTDIIANLGGNILKLERWGIKRFAYPIAKKQQGFYVYTLFEGSLKTPKELEKNYQLSEFCLRYLTLLYPGEEKTGLEAEKKLELSGEAK